MAEVIRESIHHRCDHLVQVYRDHAELAESVATYFAAGFENGQPAVAVVTAAHWPSIHARLARRGVDVGQLQSSGMLILRDADETLASLFDDGSLSQRLFDRIVGGLLDEAEATAPGKRVSAFGEMVDILARRGDRAAADVLERFWNGLMERREFSLLCGYKVDLFDPEAQLTLLPQVYRSHTHVLPPPDVERVEIAVGHALAEVLGDDAEKVYAHIARDGQADAVPTAHLALLWISAHMPRTAEQVLAAARAHYATAVAA